VGIDKENYRTYNALLSEPNLQPYFAGNSKVVVVLGFRALNNCGVGAGQLGIVDPFKGCANIKSAVMAHELGHTFDFPGNCADGLHVCDGTLMHYPVACNGKALGNCVLRSDHKSVAYNSPWFRPQAPPPVASTTVQGYKVSGTGGSMVADGALQQVQVVYQDNVGGAGRAGNAAVQGAGSSTYFFHNIPQGWHRFNILNIPSGWQLIGSTLCYDRTDCHGQAPSGMSSFNGSPTIVINSTGHRLADLWFHFQRTSSPPPNNPQNPPPPSNVTFSAVYSARAGNSNKCIDVPQQNFRAGTIVQLWDCNGTLAQQMVYGSDQSLRINGWCLDVPQQNFSKGVKIQLYACNGTAAQKWVGGSDGAVHIRDKCLDVPQQNFNNGVQLQLWDCNNTIAQKWYVR
jgi:hypothetical protein